MIIDLATLSLFSAAAGLLLLSPGPNMAFVVAHGVSHGWRGGVAAALGIAVADLVLTALTAAGVTAAGVTAAGVTAAVAGWPPAFDLIRWAGVGYLLWMAWGALRRPGFLQAGQLGTGSLASVAVRAMWNSLFNPKALLFFMVFLPQFVDTGKGRVAEQLLVLGFVLAAIAAVFHAALGALGGAVHRLVPSHPRAARWRGRGMALVLSLLAARLALMSRP